MTIVVVKESIAASAEAVWEILGNFGGIKWGVRSRPFIWKAKVSVL